MTDSLRELIADVVKGHRGSIDGGAEGLAAALLDSPTLAAIIDLAASHVDGTFDVPVPSPEVRALLAAWRASRAEQEPTP